MTTPDIVALQTSPDAAQPTSLSSGTNLLLPPVRTPDRFAHFPEEVYDLSAESHLTRFLKVLLGDAGAGQARKRMLIARMQQTLQGTHFYDLDRFYGGLFGVRRSQSEILSLDPYRDTATAETWTQQHAKDASYRSRVSQFARAITYGATPTGMELVAEALLAVDCDVYESYTQADSSYRTVGEIESGYATVGDMEGVSIGTLEGAALGRMAGDNRREFVVRPKRRITQGEAYDLGRVLSRIKPADARFTINAAGVDAFERVQIRGALADSNYWEIVPRVQTQAVVASPYQVDSLSPVEQPRPPFSGYQGEAWSYIGDVIGVSAYVASPSNVMPTQRVTLPDGSFIDYEAHSALLPKRHILAGRAASDGVLVTHPYWSQSAANVPDLAPIYTDRVPLDALAALLDNSPLIDALPQSPAERFWVTPERDNSDTTPEVYEIRLGLARAINYFAFEAAHYPHDILVETYDDSSGRWSAAATRSITNSIPQYLPMHRPVEGHPQHSQPGHWLPYGIKINPVTTRRIRFTLTRNGGLAPLETLDREVSYSLALRSVDVGYRVHSLDDVPTDKRDGSAIGTTTDPVGSTVEFSLRQQTATDLVAGRATTWKCEPQPVNYAVVNFYLDVRTAVGDSQMIERFFLDPTHSGAHLTIYWTADVGEPDEAFYERATWTPIPRDYTLQKGYVHIPPTMARHFKFEFTALNAEPFESFLPIVRTVRLFPPSLISAIAQGTSMATEDLPAGLQATMNIASTDVRYADALAALTYDSVVSQGYQATEALYAINPVQSQDMRSRSWVYGFQPWHQGDAAPRFLTTGQHTYATVQMKHTTKVGFFVGLYDIKAFRLNNGADDDTQVYTEHFHDFRQITPGFTWTFNPNALTTEMSSSAVATSQVYSSLHNVRALQFATQQSEPDQLIPDDDFRDPAKASYDWTSPDDWHRIGDAVLVYSPVDHSVVTVRYAQPLEQPLTQPTKALDQAIVHPVFSYRTTPFVSTTQSAGQFGGIESPPLGVASRGRAYAAVRLTIQTDLDSPLLLQIVNNADNSVRASMAITGLRGETIERVLPYDLTGLTAVKVRLIQQGVSDDQWKIDTLSLFDEGIVWEFSVNGGTDWVQAVGVRNNANGMITFPDPGNQLVWRVSGLRPRLAVTSLKIRPQYVGVQNARYLGTERGPNVSVFDADLPVQLDPEFTDWTKPVPRSWYAAYKRFPILPVEGAPNVTEFARFYGRPVGDTITGSSDAVQAKKITARTGSERMDFFQPLAESASHTGSRFFRTPGDAAAVTSDIPTWFKPPADPARLVNRPVHPV